MVNTAHIRTEKLNLWFGDNHVLKAVDVLIYDKKITAMIGPSGCGKSTLLRCFNRMNDLITDTKIKGKVMLYDENIYNPKADVTKIRTKVGMVFQKPNPYPKSIYKNVDFGYVLNDEDKIKEIVVIAKKNREVSCICYRYE